MTPDRNARGSVLVVDDHADARESMAFVLRQAGHRVEGCSSAAEALHRIQNEQFDCIITDLKMPGMSGIEFILQLEERRYKAQVVMVTAHASVATAVQAMRHGAFDYIEKPFDAEQLEDLVAQAVRHGRLVRDDAGGAGGPARPQAAHQPPVMIGSGPAMQALRAKIDLVARTAETVLILGENGTGKELVARSIHAQSDRRQGPLVSLNCPALSAHLLESELFGHEKGAFTGADTARVGRFERADGGSILLDEVTEIEPPLQAKLLRVLQERTFERVGSSETRRVDVRVLATTNRDLRAQVDAGRFREDLYFRLAVLPIHVPPLRDRREDVPELVQHFLARAAARLGRDPCSLDASAMDLLMNYHWPGNVRELENLMTRASVLSSEGPLGADEIRRWLLADPKAPAQAAGPATAGIPVGLSLEEMERRLIEATLERFGGHREKTAKALGIGVRTLCGKLRQYGYAPRAKSLGRAA
ncbi:MAG: sigma-54 dependent transcriptional regulator [Thermoguttaceae bacterium]|jgi:DNA-binding NtrC family response regulator|nr:sigma-54 dependent transcriptional regulator [Thermoguttaceae bacterium]